MVDRTVKVLVSAQVNGYLSGMDRVQQKTKAVTASAEEQSDAFKSLGSTAALAIGAIGAAAAAAATLAIVQFARFDKQMSTVHAATQETAEGMNLLREAALDAGTKTQYSAIQAAEAITELGKAGISTSDILSGGLSAALNLAASDNLDLGVAAGIAATTMQQFGLQGKDAGHVADLLAAGANKALGGVEDLANGLKFVGPVAASMGVSLDETTAALASFANQGILGEQAGTSLRGVLSSLTSPSSQAKAQLDSLGVTLYDSTGKFLGLANMAGQLENAYKGMNDEQRDASLGIIFGNQQITAARLLYQQGAKGINDWVKAIDEQGYAAKIAAQQMDNLSGDVTKLGNAFNVSLIKAGSASNDVLRALVQAGTDLVKSFSAAPPPVQATILAVLALTAGFGLLAGAAAFLIPKIYETAVALNVLSTSSIPAVAKAATVMLTSVRAGTAALSATVKLLTGPWGIAMTAAALGVGILEKALDGLKASSSELQNAIKTGSTDTIFQTATQGLQGWHDVQADLKDLPNVLQASADQASNIFARFDSSHFAAFGALRDIGKELASLASTDLPAAQAGFQKLADKTDGSKKQLWELLNTMPDYKDALVEQANKLGLVVTGSDEAENKTNLLKIAFGTATEKSDDAATAYKNAADKAKGLDTQISDLIDTINTANGVGQDAVSANASYQKSIADATQAVKDYVNEHGQSAAALDETTLAGSKNAAMLAGLASDSQAAAKAQFDLDANTDNYKTTLQKGRDEIYKTALALTGNADAAQALTDKIYAMPSGKEITFLADTSRAKRALDEFLADITSRKPVLYIEGQIVRTGQPQFKAAGGTVGGVGTSKSDSNLVYLSRGEEVTQEPYASRFRRELKLMNQGIVPSFANGGTVGYSPAPPRYASQFGGFDGPVAGATVHVTTYTQQTGKQIAADVARELRWSQ